MRCKLVTVLQCLIWSVPAVNSQNACDANPCLNGGTCKPDVYHPFYECDCPDDVNGDNCQHKFCKNGGAFDGIGGCYCTAEWEGRRCHIKRDPCKSTPCQNGGICKATSAIAFTCTCPFGIFGLRCELKGNPCWNNGVVVMETTWDNVQTEGYSCTCATGYLGEKCETSTICQTNPCQNDGACSLTPTGIQTCKCQPGYTGVICDQEAAPGNPCVSSPCLNGGECEQKTSTAYVCRCPSAFYGARCEGKIDAVQCRNTLPRIEIANTASSGQLSIHHSPEYGLSVARSWMPAVSDSNQWIAVELTQPRVLFGILLQAWTGSSSRVTKFHLQYASVNADLDSNLWPKAGNWLDVQNHDNKETFDGNWDNATPSEGWFYQPIVPKYVKVIPTEWSIGISLKFELFGCGAERCDSPLGIKDHQLSSSTYKDVNSEPRFAQLDSTTGWTAKADDQFQWIQVNLGRLELVSGIVTQGRYDRNEWVTQFHIKYSENGQVWHYVNKLHESIKKVFTGNFNSHTRNINSFPNRVWGKYVQIIPTGWYQHISMRFDILACKVCDQCIRLNDNGKFTTNQGRVEILHNYEWGTVCGNDWDPNDAKVVCLASHQTYWGALAIPDAFKFGPGNRKILLDKVACTGFESSLYGCPHAEWETLSSNCDGTKDAGVVCANPPGVFLVGTDPMKGRVEIEYNGERGTVCDIGWDNNDALVFCRQLGFIAGQAHHGGYFGEGTGKKIWLSNLDCKGTEGKLWECDHDGWGFHNCDHSRDAGVVCYDKTVRLRQDQTDNKYQGYVEIFHDGIWGGVCKGYTWGDKEAKVACRQAKAPNVSGAERSFVDHWGSNLEKMWLTNIRCTGDEQRLEDCYLEEEWGDVKDCKPGVATHAARATCKNA